MIRKVDLQSQQDLTTPVTASPLSATKQLHSSTQSELSALRKDSLGSFSFSFTKDIEPECFFNSVLKLIVKRSSTKRMAYNSKDLIM